MHPVPGGKPHGVSRSWPSACYEEPPSSKVADPAMVKEAMDYLGKNAQSFEEVRMAIAGLEAVHGSSPDFPKWNEMLQGMRNPDGTWGEGPGQAYATGGAGAAVLRMGMTLDKRDAVITAAEGRPAPRRRLVQRRRSSPTLAATCRIMRALYMLHERPDIDRLLTFVARCRQSDGSYASKPGGAGDLGGTYTATIVIYWVRQLLGVPTVVETPSRLSPR